MAAPIAEPATKVVKMSGCVGRRIGKNNQIAAHAPAPMAAPEPSDANDSINLT
jgi:hypothetical protein